MLLLDEFGQGGKFGVCLRLPVAAGAQHAQQGVGVGQQILGQRFLEQRAGQPLEAAFQWAAVGCIGLGGASAVVGFGAQPVAAGGVSFLVAFLIGKYTVRVFVVVASVQQFRALGAQRNVQPVLDGV